MAPKFQSLNQALLVGWGAWQRMSNYFMSDWMDTNADFSDCKCLTPQELDV